MAMKVPLCFIVNFSMAQALSSTQNVGSEDLPLLLLQFRSAPNIEAKERLLNVITTNFPNAGSALLELAETTTDTDTKWMAIRGIGTLKYKMAAPFLVESLLSEHRYVRSNSARALGDMKAYSAQQALITLLRDEQDGGVIEQTSLALRMIGATEAVPVLKSKASHPSPQTRAWIFQAIGFLGSKNDVPFLAGHLCEEDPFVSVSAAQAIEKIMRVDFGFPKAQGPSVVPEDGLKNARRWWTIHKSSWGPTSQEETPK